MFKEKIFRVIIIIEYETNLNISINIPTLQ